MYRWAKDMKDDGLVAADSNHGGMRVKGSSMAGDAPARMAAMAWFETQKQVSGRRRC